MIRQTLPPSGTSRLPASSKPTVGKGHALAGHKKDEILHPIIIDNDKAGTAQNSQPTFKVDRDQEISPLPWNQTLSTTLAGAFHTRTAIFVALKMAHQSGPEFKDSLDVLGREDGKGKTEVKTKRDFEPGELMLVPLVSGLQHIVTETTKESAVPCGGFFLLNSVGRKKDQEFLPPFWCARRSEAEHEVNTVLIDIELNNIASLLSQAPLASIENSDPTVSSIKLPILTNPVRLVSGAEIVVMSKGTIKSKGEKQIGWQDQVKKPRP